MSELTLTLLRLGLLALLWFFVFAVVGVLRGDLYGTRVSRRRARSVARRSTSPAAPAAASPAGMPSAASAGMPPATSQPSGPRASAPARGRGGRGRGGRGIPTSLAVTEGRLAGTVLPLGGSPMIIGRNPECALVLEDDFASGRHLRLFPRDGGWWAEDLGSTNGTFLGGGKLAGAQPVQIGSILRIGRTVLELQG